ncbi:nucleotidyltransferase domain-containing protein [Blautia schinkii]|nr:nucleotidyltransferase domain-containing protein [Blautia schinkii]
MSKKIYTPEQIKDILYPVFRAHNVRRAVLFGSYVKGKAKENSDVDILVDSGLHGLAFYGLLEDVVTSLGKDVDLLDLAEIVPDSQVDKEIKNNGVVIYGK